MKKLVIDLEMAAPISVKDVQINEIIEIGAVLMDDADNLVQKYHTYVKNEYGKISAKISQLTRITEQMTNSAPKLGDALNNMLTFMLPNGCDNTKLYTWSSSDTTEILKELSVKGIDNPNILLLCNEYVDIQKVFMERMGLSKRVNLGKALNMIGIEFEGQEHGALADAVNTTTMLKAMNDEGKVKETMQKIKDAMTPKNIGVSLGSMFDFSKFR